MRCCSWIVRCWFEIKKRCQKWRSSTTRNQTIFLSHPFTTRYQTILNILGWKDKQEELTGNLFTKIYFFYLKIFNLSINWWFPTLLVISTYIYTTLTNCKVTKCIVFISISSLIIFLTQFLFIYEIQNETNSYQKVNCCEIFIWKNTAVNRWVRFVSIFQPSSCTLICSWIMVNRRINIPWANRVVQKPGIFVHLD